MSITPNYLADTLSLIQTIWNRSRKRFLTIEASKLVGKLARLAEGAPRVRYLVSFLCTSIALTLTQNKDFLVSSSRNFQRLYLRSNLKMSVIRQKSSHLKIILFVIKKAARKVYHCQVQRNTLPLLRKEIDFFEQVLKRRSGVTCKSPITFFD